MSHTVPDGLVTGFCVVLDEILCPTFKLLLLLFLMALQHCLGCQSLLEKSQLGLRMWNMMTLCMNHYRLKVIWLANYND